MPGRIPSQLVDIAALERKIYLELLEALDSMASAGFALWRNIPSRAQSTLHVGPLHPCCYAQHSVLLRPISLLGLSFQAQDWIVLRLKITYPNTD